MILYREAGVPVKKLSGYAKGYGTSADKPFSTSMKTDHAWNAVQLDGNWYLLDSTWGAGHLDKTDTYVKRFDEFYFLTDPRQLIYSHFPYIDGNMKKSTKWQLLTSPVTLDRFNKFVFVKPNAFKLGVIPVSHKEGLVRMKNELKMTFKCEGKDDVMYTTELRQNEQDTPSDEIRLTTFDQVENGLFTVRVRPNKTGKFHLTLFGKKAGEEGSYHQLIKYVIKCDKVDDGSLTFPYTYTQAQTDRCILTEPLSGKLGQNSAVDFHITSPFLNRVMINKTFLEKTGTTFKGTIKTGSKGETLYVYGSRNSSGSLDGLYKFDIE